MDVHDRIRWAVVHNNLHILRRLIRRYPEYLENIDPTNGWSSLHYASYHGLYHICVFLISQGHDKEEISLTHDYCTALHLAAQSNHEQTVHFLAQHIPRCLDWVNAKHETALMVAAKYGNDPCVTLLLDFGADIDLPNKDLNRPLHIAAAYGHIKTIRTLVDRNADVQTPNAEGWRPVQYCSTYQVQDYLQSLIHEKSQRRQRAKQLKDSSGSVGAAATATTASSVTNLPIAFTTSSSARTGPAAVVTNAGVLPGTAITTSNGVAETMAGVSSGSAGTKAAASRGSCNGSSSASFHGTRRSSGDPIIVPSALARSRSIGSPTSPNGPEVNGMVSSPSSLSFVQSHATTTTTTSTTTTTTTAGLPSKQKISRNHSLPPLSAIQLQKIQQQPVQRHISSTQLSSPIETHPPLTRYHSSDDTKSVSVSSPTTAPTSVSSTSTTPTKRLGGAAPLFIRSRASTASSATSTPNGSPPFGKEHLLNLTKSRHSHRSRLMDIAVSTVHKKD